MLPVFRSSIKSIRGLIKECIKLAVKIAVCITVGVRHFKMISTELIHGPTAL